MGPAHFLHRLSETFPVIVWARLEPGGYSRVSHPRFRRVPWHPPGMSRRACCMRLMHTIMKFWVLLEERALAEGMPPGLNWGNAACQRKKAALNYT